MSSLIERVEEFAIMAHEGQMRKYTGEPYHVHVFEVRDILKGVGAREEVLAAALLHDVIEDTEFDQEDISVRFGKEIADLVMMVTDVSRPEDGNRRVRKAMDRDHLSQASSEGKTIKLADLISNSASITEHDPGFAKVYMREKKELLAVLQEGHPALYKRAAAIIDDYYEKNGASA